MRAPRAARDSFWQTAQKNTKEHEEHLKHRSSQLYLVAGLAACDGFNHVLGVDYCGPTLRSTASAFRTKACNLDNPQALVRLRQLPGLAVRVLAGEGERAAQELVVGVR